MGRRGNDIIQDPLGWTAAGNSAIRQFGDPDIAVNEIQEKPIVECQFLTIFRTSSHIDSRAPDCDYL
jgi:hypothetical protein